MERHYVVKRSILTVTIGALICVPTFDGRSAATETSETPTRTAFERGNPIEPPSCIKDAGAEIQMVWAEIEELARQYADLDEVKLLARSGITAREELSGGKVLRVVTMDAGVETEFRLGREHGYLLGVRALRADGVSVGVGFTVLLEPKRLGVESGYVITPGQGHQEIDFDSTLSVPRLAISYENALSTGKSRTKVIAWDSDGKMVLDRVLPDVTNPYEARRALMASMTVAELEAMGMPYGDRLRSCLAYKSAVPHLKRALENSVDWSERLLYTVPDTLVEDLMGEEVARREEGSITSYSVKKGGETLWTVDFDNPTGHLSRAVHGDGQFKLYYDFQNMSRLVGAMVPVRRIGEETKYWLLSFYPGQFTPRMALLTILDPAGDLRVFGEIHVWNRQGDLMISETATMSTPVVEALTKVQGALNESELTELGWRGAEVEENVLMDR